MEVKKTETKTAKVVKILKAAFKGLKVVVKWLGQKDLSIGQVIKGGLILLVVGTLIRGALFG